MGTLSVAGCNRAVGIAGQSAVTHTACSLNSLRHILNFGKIDALLVATARFLAGAKLDPLSIHQQQDFQGIVGGSVSCSAAEHVAGECWNTKQHQETPEAHRARHR